MQVAAGRTKLVPWIQFVTFKEVPWEWTKTLKNVCTDGRVLPKWLIMKHRFALGGGGNGLDPLYSVLGTMAGSPPPLFLDPPLLIICVGLSLWFKFIHICEICILRLKKGSKSWLRAQVYAKNIWVSWPRDLSITSTPVAVPHIHLRHGARGRLITLFDLGS